MFSVPKTVGDTHVILLAHHMHSGTTPADAIRDWSLITGRGGYKTGVGAREVLPLRKGGAEKVLAMLKGGAQKV